MGFIRASLTLMLKIMIMKSVSMPTLKMVKSHGDDAAQKMTWNWICSNVDDQLKATLKDHPTHKASHQVFTADNTIQ